MNAQHTPGPWLLGEDQCVDERWSIVTTSGGAIIANVNDQAARQANARLIAAAPDLLEALDNLWAWVKNWDAEFMDDQEFDRSIYEAAIAKAKGGDA